MRLRYSKVFTIYIYSVIADVRLLLWPIIHSSYIQSAAHHGPVVALQCSLRLQLIYTVSGKKVPLYFCP